MGDGRPAQVLRQKATSVTKTQKNPNKPDTSTITKTTKRELKPYNSQTNLRSNNQKEQKVMQTSASTRRFSRGGAKDKNLSENTKEEAKSVTKEEKTTKTTKKTRGRRSILKK